jgi:hypothetical protein
VTDVHRAGAVLLVAVCTEEGELRGRLTGADDLGVPTRAVGAAHGVEDLTRAVGDWLRDRADEVGADPDGGTAPPM